MQFSFLEDVRRHFNFPREVKGLNGLLGTKLELVLEITYGPAEELPQLVLNYVLPDKGSAVKQDMKEWQMVNGPAL